MRVSLAWVASPSSTQQPRKASAAAADATGSATIKTAKFFKTTATVLAEEATMAAAQAVASGTAAVAPETVAAATAPTPLSEIRRLPWMREDGSSDSDDDDDDSDVFFLDHWNWQLSFFEENLTDLRVRDVEEQHHHSGRDDESLRELYYASTDLNDGEKKCSRVYTISMESVEYRDIRMTYMHCPDLQTFRCLSYPRNGDVPVMGMSVIRMGGVRNLSVMDYQPLPPPSDDDETESKINDAYTAALLESRREIPSMSAPITHKNFAKKEEQHRRSYFTEFPLLGRCNDLEATDAEIHEYRETVRKAQRRHVSKHVELTRRVGRSADPLKLSPGYVLERHSDFDTNVSEREPALGFLRGVFGSEKGDRIFHNVIFPLSRHGLYGEEVEEEEEEHRRRG